MLITYYGHALFALETADGRTVVTDPYDASVGYPMGRLKGDAVTISHEHHDHNNLSLIEGQPRVIRGEGTFLPLPGIQATGFPSYHDDCLGEKRGKNTLFLLEMDGLRLLHLGDLGHMLAEDMCHALLPVDVLMIPVGGFYTIGPEEAARLCQALHPRILIPMHYKTAHSARLPIAPVEDFLRLLSAHPAPMPLLRVTKEDISRHPRVALLTPKPLPTEF